MTIRLAPASLLSGIMSPFFSFAERGGAVSSNSLKISQGDNMKRALTICGLFCALMIGVAAVSAQKGANFAGTWELDKSKSQLSQRQADSIKSATWTVTQDDKQLTSEQKIERVEGAGGGPGGGGGRGRGFGMGGGQVTVKLDGSETTTESERGKTVSKAKWLNDGKTLEITSVRSGAFQGNAFTFTTTENWELSDGGKTLKVHVKTESQRGPQESTYVLSKK